MQISFHGAAGTVTGSKHLITLWDNERILLDCGLFQGLGKDTKMLNREWGFEPSSVHHVVLSHAHVDHSGLLPKLVKDGFEGKIYCTPATFALCEIMLMDSAHIQEADVHFVNKQKRKEGKEEIEALYTQEDTLRCLEQFVEVEFDEPFKIRKHIEVLFTDNGHILGSATVNLTINEVNEITKVAFTGDIGRYGTPLMKDPSPFRQADILITESTYGDRLHDDQTHADQDILNAVVDTCVKKKGKLIIPSFSLGRTQEVVYTLNKLNLHGLIPEIKIYVDSPLAVNATEIMRDYASSLNADVQELIRSRPDPFGFDRLTYITDKRDSQQLNQMNGPMVIISAAGMAEAGRIKHHLMHNIQQPENTILIVGYAEPRSLAGKLRSGEKEVTIFGKEFHVNAEVRVIDSLSAHGDQKEMIQYLGCLDPKKVRKIFVVHGDPEAQLVFKDKLKDAGFNNIFIPEMGSEYKI